MSTSDLAPCPGPERAVDVSPPLAQTERDADCRDPIPSQTQGRTDADDGADGTPPDGATSRSDDSTVDTENTSPTESPATATRRSTRPRKPPNRYGDWAY